jgi:hypothetical protein
LTEDLAARWVLKMLDQYPTAQRLAGARLASLQKIPYLAPELAQQVQLAAQQSVASLSGPVAETLVRDLVAQVRHCQQNEEKLRQCLTQAFDALPPSPHSQLLTIPGIDLATAAVLTAKIVNIERFATAARLVNYFGVFPEENSSGVDKHGQPLPPGTLVMSRKGNDLARHYLWNAARVGIRFNPAVRALYRRLKAKGTRGDVALGHCMTKLVHLAFAVWKTNRPFNPQHYPWEPPANTSPPSTSPVPAAASTAAPANKKAVGHKRDVPATEVVTTADTTVTPPLGGVNPTAPPRAARPRVDYAFLRQQVTMEQVLGHLGWLGHLRGPLVLNSK